MIEGRRAVGKGVAAAPPGAAARRRPLTGVATAAHWSDLRDHWPDRGAWRGLELVVTAPARPGLVVQAARRRLRLALGARPLAWTRVQEHHAGASTLVGRDAPRVLPPITAARARSAPQPGSDARWATWARWLVRDLLEADASPLAAGLWHITPSTSELRAERFEAIPAQEAVDDQPWSFTDLAPPLALRPLASADSARVKAWRRCAREGCLPPLVLWFVSGLHRHVLLDGHDRLVAALAESAPPLALVLTQMRPRAGAGAVTPHAAGVAASIAASAASAPPAQLDGLNRALVRTFDHGERPVWMTRAWPIPGGRVAWDAEVAAELAARGLPADALAP